MKFIFIFILGLSSLFSEGVESLHKISIGGNEIAYKTEVASIPLKDKENKVKGEIFYVSYMKETTDSTKPRPVTFCFNGGPGSSSVWLHMGLLGPKRIPVRDKSKVSPPYSIEENPYSLLDVTDLVFIDPISTGFSKAISEEAAKEFYGVDEDVKSVAECIRFWLSKNNRWESPKYIVGESYGTTRAASLALKLHDEEYCYLNGVILISSVLNFQTIYDKDSGNDLPYILSLPSYTIGAWYHKLLSDDLQKDFYKTKNDVEAFALNEYGPALLKGELLSSDEKIALVKKLSYYTGLSEKYLLQSNMRVPVARFAKELLRDNSRIIGRFDCRIQGIDSDETHCVFGYDPSFQGVAGAFSGGFNDYIRGALGWKSDEPYRLLTDVFPWNWGKANNSFLNVGNNLREVMSKNSDLKVFVASGYFDLATPYFATDYTFSHLNLAPSQKSNITFGYYFGGHMMYLDEAIQKQMKEDLSKFYKE